MFKVLKVYKIPSSLDKFTLFIYITDVYKTSIIDIVKITRKVPLTYNQ